MCHSPPSQEGIGDIREKIEVIYKHVKLQKVFTQMHFEFMSGTFQVPQATCKDREIIVLDLLRDQPIEMFKWTKSPMPSYSSC